MSPQYGELWLTSGWDRFVSLGHPTKFQLVSRLGSVTARHVVPSVSQTLRRWTEGATYVRQGDLHIGNWPTFLVQLIILRPHAHFTRHARKQKSAKASAFYTFENPPVRRSGLTKSRPHDRTTTARWSRSTTADDCTANAARPQSDDRTSARRLHCFIADSYLRGMTRNERWTNTD